jgi:hypothetical protein
MQDGSQIGKIIEEVLEKDKEGSNKKKGRERGLRSRLLSQPRLRLCRGR